MSGDPAVRADSHQQAERIVMSNFAVIPIAQFQIFGVLSDRVRGFEMETSGTFDATKVWMTSG
jgi:MarR-like DNA-binding transcriptional regulator SgrR of sgrS sRNA